MFSLFLPTLILISDGSPELLNHEAFVLTSMRSGPSHRTTSASAPGLPMLQQAKRIESLEQKFKASRNWLRDHYLWASTYFKKYTVPFPYLWKAYDVTPPLPKPAEDHNIVINAIREIQNCLAGNFNISSKQ
jgi:hypothetical protein